MKITCELCRFESGFAIGTSNGEKRSVTTLSGGEKFLLALSLAIGLSTVVQAQSGGTRLDAMFIDEGFAPLILIALMTL